MAESAELETWIQEQYAAASSEDYGQDYEHLLVRIIYQIIFKSIHFSLNIRYLIAGFE